MKNTTAPMVRIRNSMLPNCLPPCGEGRLGFGFCFVGGVGECVVNGFGDARGVVGVVEPQHVPPNVSLESLRHAFLEIIPLKPELGFVAAGVLAVIDTINIEFPRSAGAVADVLDGDAVANFPAEALCGSGSHDRAFTVCHEFLPLVIGNDQFGHNLALIFRVYHELWEEVFLILIDAAEPVVVGDGFDSWDAQDLITVRKGNRLDDGDAVDGHKAIRTGNIGAAARCS